MLVIWKLIQGIKTAIPNSRKRNKEKQQNENHQADHFSNDFRFKCIQLRPLYIKKIF